MPSVHGVRSNGIPLSMDAVTFVDLLRDAGYRTALIGKSHLQNFTDWPTDHQAAAAARGLPRAVGRADAVAARRSRRAEIRAGDAGLLDQSRARRCSTPFYGFDHVTLVRAHGDEPGGDYDRWLDARDPKAKNAARAEEQPAARLHGAAGLSHRDPGGALRHRVPRRPRLRLSRRRQGRRAVLPDGVVSRSAPSVQSAGQILGHVQARAVPGAGGVLAQRLDAAGAGAEHHQGARGRQGQSHRHEHHRRVGARGAGGEGADLRHDRLRRRCHRAGARRARRAAASATTPW